MKSIEETHPSLPIITEYLSGKEILRYILPEHVQKHTIDKAVLKEILERKRETPFMGTEAAADLYGQVIDELLGLVE